MVSCFGAAGGLTSNGNDGFRKHRGFSTDHSSSISFFQAPPSSKMHHSVLIGRVNDQLYD
jgi:hypothetical protein